VAELSLETGLDEQQSRLAKARISSEPLKWQDTEQRLELFKKDLKKQKIKLVHGGRFLHAMGNFDKVDGIKWLIKKYTKLFKDKEIITIGFGDSQNDLEMLKFVDYPVVIPDINGNVLNIDNSDTVIYSNSKGSDGWQEGVDQLMELSII